MSNAHTITGREIAAVVRAITTGAAAAVIPATGRGYENDRAAFVSDFHGRFFYGDGDLIAYTKERTAHRGALTTEQAGLIVSLDVAIRDLYTVRATEDMRERALTI